MSAAGIAAPGQPAESGQLAQSLSGRLGEFGAASGLAACLMPLLTVLGWRGRLRQVAEALPHFADTLDVPGLRNTLANLDFGSRRARTRLDRIDARSAPVLFVPDDGRALVVLGAREGGIEVYDASAGQPRVIVADERPGTAYLFRPKEVAPESERLAAGWFRTLAARFRGLGAQLLGIGLVLNLLGTAIPLFVMVVYDFVIASDSILTLLHLTAGAGLAIGFDLLLRALRARALAYLGTRIDMMVGVAAFQRILHLPPSMTEQASVSAQVSRLKDFERVREFFTGPFALAFLDLPFALLFIVLIALLGGWLAVVPAALMALLGLLSPLVLSSVRPSVERAQAAVARYHGFLVESVSNLRAVRECAAEDTWALRHRELSAAAATAKLRAVRHQAVIQTTAHVLLVTGGIATVAIGALRVLDGAMTVGALVACMIMIWRATGPLQACFVSISRLEQVRGGIRQLDALMRLRPERSTPARATTTRRYRGAVTFVRAGLRYAAEADPALLGVSFHVEPGELFAVTGPSGSGKSTLLKLAAGLYVPQAGVVSIDGQDIRQLDAIGLRQTVSYMPQTTQLFYGTIAQNLRLAEPTADDDALKQATARAGVLADIEALPDGFDTQVRDQTMRHLPPGFQQRLALARAYLREAPILLLDEPANGLDAVGDTALMEELRRLHGKVTVVMATHRPSHMQLADRVLVLERGAMRSLGPAGEVLGRLKEGTR